MLDLSTNRTTRTQQSPPWWRASRFREVESICSQSGRSRPSRWIPGCPCCGCPAGRISSDVRIACCCWSCFRFCLKNRGRMVFAFPCASPHSRQRPSFEHAMPIKIGLAQGNRGCLREEPAKKSVPLSERISIMRPRTPRRRADAAWFGPEGETGIPPLQSIVRGEN